MLEATMCNYPALLFELIPAYNYFLTGGMFFVFLITGHFFLQEKGLESVVASIIFSILLTALMLNIFAASNYFQGQAAQHELQQFNYLVANIGKANYPDNEKYWIKEWAQCSIEDGKISKFEYKQLKYKIEKF